jgi:hypothetical protein
MLHLKIVHGPGKENWLSVADANIDILVEATPAPLREGRAPLDQSCAATPS